MINNASFAGSILYWWASRQHRRVDRADSLLAVLAAKHRTGVEHMVEREKADEVQAQLLGRIATQDLQAMRAFYDQTAAPLFSLAVRILGDRSEAEDAIQDAFIQIWDKAASFDPMLGSAFHWAMSIARHRSIDRLRARGRRSRLKEEFQNASEPELNWLEQAPWTADESAAVCSALEGLPLDQREAIKMAFFGGKTHLEIAEALHEPLGTIKARIRRGMLKLRDSLPTLE